jgi:hypothetical protein
VTGRPIERESRHVPGLPRSGNPLVVIDAERPGKHVGIHTKLALQHSTGFRKLHRDKRLIGRSGEPTFLGLEIRMPVRV